MSDIAIRVDGLGKQYRVGAKQEPYRTLRDQLTEWMALPWRMARSLGRRNGQHQESDSLFWALRDISFDVKFGEVVGIIGRNGAGKTTLLKILSRITEPTEGSADIYGRVGSLLEVGTGFHAELTGRENILLNGAILGMGRSEIRRQFDDIVAFAEVERFVDTPVKHYSSGMYVRLAFAVAAHLNPQILIVDEVLSVGDVAFQKKCLTKIDDVGRAGRTVLVVSHNLAMIMNLCRRAILLSEGKKLADGPPAEVIDNYLSAGREVEGEIVWTDPATAPGNEVVRLRSIKVLQEGIEGSTGEVDIAKDVDIEMSFWNLSEGACFYSALWLKDRHGTPVLSTMNARGISLVPDHWWGQPHPIGIFRSTCRIPGNFLNEGLYRLTPIVGTVPCNTQLLQEDVLSFFVHDTGEMRKEYYGGWIGTVRPRLAWRTEHVQSPKRSVEVEVPPLCSARSGLENDGREQLRA